MPVALESHPSHGVAPAHPIALAATLLACAVAGLVEWFGYVLIFTFTLFECMGGFLGGSAGHPEGGALGTEWHAAGIGVVLLVGAAYLGWRRASGRFLRLLLGYVVVYAAALLLLGGVIAPLVQGSQHCVYP